MKCEKCGNEYKDKSMHQHHYLPYSIFKTYDCPTITLCSWCHKKFHAQLEAMEYTTKGMILCFTAYWLEGKPWDYRKEEIFPLCPKCHNTDNHLFLFRVGKNYLILHCPICGYRSEKDFEAFILWYRKELRKISMENKKIFLSGKEEVKEDDSL